MLIETVPCSANLFNFVDLEATCVNGIEQTRNGPVVKCCVLFELPTQNLHAWSWNLKLTQPMTGNDIVNS